LQGACNNLVGPLGKIVIASSGEQPYPGYIRKFPVGFGIRDLYGDFFQFPALFRTLFRGRSGGVSKNGFSGK
jgi:hypothetical protein